MNFSLTTAKQGLKDGIPIGLGYLSVSFTFGLMAANQHLSVPEAVIISMTNLTSAGQFAGLDIISSSGSFAEMALTQLIINIRYALMSLSLSQKLDKSFTTPHRLITAFGITDEIFAVASSKDKLINKKYMYALILIPFLGWSLGTLAGAAAGGILPARLKSALGIAIYGMFLAIIIPPSKKSRGVLAAVIISSLISCLTYYLTNISSGFSIIICAVAAAAAAALFMPVNNDEKEEETK